MIKIKTKADLNHLRACADISQDYYIAVAEHLDRLIEALAPPDVDPAQYNLEQDGYLVILTASDNPHDMNGVGLPAGLINSWPEYVEVLTLDAEKTVFRIAVLYTNDVMMFFYIDSMLYQNDTKYQQFLQEQLEYQNIYTDGGSDL